MFCDDALSLSTWQLTNPELWYIVRNTTRLFHIAVGWVIITPVLGLSLLGFSGIQTRLLFNTEFSTRMDTAKIIANGAQCVGPWQSLVWYVLWLNEAV
jgi:hypothetical protein